MKTGPDGWNAAGASAQSLVSGDGYLEFTVPTPADLLCGFSTRAGLDDNAFERLPCRRRVWDRAQNWESENMLVCTECRWPIAHEYVATLE